MTKKYKRVTSTHDAYMAKMIATLMTDKDTEDLNSGKITIEELFQSKIADLDWNKTLQILYELANKKK